MKEVIIDFFNNNANMILFIHVMGAMVWVGGMIAIRFAVHPVLQQIEDSNIRLSKTLNIMKNFFNIVKVFIGLIVLSAVFMAVGLGFKESDPMLYQVVHIKEAIWTIMTILFTIMYLRRNKAEKYFISGDLSGAKEQLMPLSKWMIPLNIALGLFALILGGVLRGF